MLLEVHRPGYQHTDPTHKCTCSYCGNTYDKGLHFGLNVPKDLFAWNSWWVLKLAPRVYVRWNMPRWVLGLLARVIGGKQCPR